MREIVADAARIDDRALRDRARRLPARSAADPRASAALERGRRVQLSLPDDRPQARRRHLVLRLHDDPGVRGRGAGISKLPRGDAGPPRVARRVSLARDRRRGVLRAHAAAEVRGPRVFGQAIARPAPRSKRAARPSTPIFSPFGAFPKARWNPGAHSCVAKSADALAELSLALLENADARADAREVQADLRAIRRFWRAEAQRLARAMRRTAHAGYPLAQARARFAFLRYKYSFPEFTSIHSEGEP